MSHEQPLRSQGGQHQEPVRYGDVFQVTGDLADKPVAPQDAAMMQSAEATVFGQTLKGGPAASMQSAATVNEMAGIVGHEDVTDVTGDTGVTVTATEYSGGRMVTESFAGQVVGQFYKPSTPEPTAPAEVVQAELTIGEALEATAITAGTKPVDESDAAAIQAAEVRATGSNVITPGGVAAAAQSAATFNAGLDRDEDKIKLSEVLTDATGKLLADKAATRADAEGVMSAELRNNPNLTTYPGGVAGSVASAARLNEGAT